MVRVHAQVVALRHVLVAQKRVWGVRVHVLVVLTDALVALHVVQSAHHHVLANAEVNVSMNVVMVVNLDVMRAVPIVVKKHALIHVMAHVRQSALALL